MGIAGIAILVVLVSISIGAVVLVPVETFQQWNNPQSWISYPKTAIPEVLAVPDVVSEILLYLPL